MEEGNNKLLINLLLINYNFNKNKMYKPLDKDYKALLEEKKLTSILFENYLFDFINFNKLMNYKYIIINFDLINFILVDTSFDKSQLIKFLRVYFIY